MKVYQTPSPLTSQHLCSLAGLPCASLRGLCAISVDRGVDQRRGPAVRGKGRLVHGAVETLTHTTQQVTTHSSEPHPALCRQVTQCVGSLQCRVSPCRVRCRYLPAQLLLHLRHAHHQHLFHSCARRFHIHRWLPQSKQQFMKHTLSAGRFSVWEQLRSRSATSPQIIEAGECHFRTVMGTC